MKGPLFLFAIPLVSMALTSACSPSPPPTLPMPSGLTYEEYELVGGPTLEPFGFVPVKGTMETILQPRQAERSRRVIQESLFLQGHHALQVPYGGGTLTATESYSPDGSSGSVVVTLGDQELYRIDIGMASPITALRGLWAWPAHWAVETDYFTREAFAGRLSVDGVLVCPAGHCQEAFDFQLIRGRPLYFLKRAERIDLSFDGQEVTLGFDEVPHYQCCSASVLNPQHAEHMVAFFGRRDRTWYYVEIGAYGQ